MRFLLIPLTFVLIGCGSGGGDGGGDATGGGVPPAATTPVTTYYPSGRVKETGFVVTGTDQRTDAWTVFFDQDDGQKQWEGSYSGNAIDAAKPWTEWNADGSVRIDSTDL